MPFSFTNIYQSSYLRYGLPVIIYFVPALYFQYLSDVDTKDCKIILPPIFVYLFTYVHQLLFNSPATPCRLPYPIDLLLTLFEMAAYLILWRFSYSPDPAVLSLAAFDLINFVVLSMIGFLKLCDVIKGKGFRDLSARYDYLNARTWTKKDSEEATEIWESGSMTKHLTFLVSRFMVVLFVYFTIGFAWSTIVIASIREAESIPLRASKSFQPLGTNFKTGISDVWNVIVGRPTTVGADVSSGQALESAVEAILLSSGTNSDLKIPCPLLTSWESSNRPRKDLFTTVPMTLDARAFQCPYKSDILITVNFTKLGIVIPPSGSTGVTGADSDGIRNSVVQVMLGSVADDPSDVISRTEVPMMLIPGVNLVGFAKMHILQKFKRPALSTLGLFGSYNSYLVPEIVNLSPDPQAQPLASSPLIPQSPDIATIRIIPLIDLAEWRIVQEYRDRSVLKGFSIVGGLWTFLGGVFAFLFGKSISYIVFNIKPLSIFGIVHQFQKDSIGDHYREKYPDIEQNITERGYEQFMTDHFVALDLIKTAAIQEEGQGQGAPAVQPLEPSTQVGTAMSGTQPEGLTLAISTSSTAPTTAAAAAIPPGIVTPNNSELATRSDGLALPVVVQPSLEPSTSGIQGEPEVGIVIVEPAETDSVQSQTASVAQGESVAQLSSPTAMAINATGVGSGVESSTTNGEEPTTTTTTT